MSTDRYLNKVVLSGIVRRFCLLIQIMLLGVLVVACQDNGDSNVMEGGESNPALEDYLKQSLSRSLNEQNPTERGTFAADSATSKAQNFSLTNVQEAGVDEADLVKFNGDYLFIAQQPTMQYGIYGEGGDDIVEVAASSRMIAPYLPVVEQPAAIRVLAPDNNPSAPEVASIPLETDIVNIQGMYSYKTTNGDEGLAVIENRQLESADQKSQLVSRPYIFIPQRAQVELFNVQMPQQAGKTWQFGFDGWLVSSRRIDQTLYLVSQYMPSLEYATLENSEATAEAILNEIPVKDLLPKAYVNGSERLLVQASDCVVPEDITADYQPTLVTIVAIDLTQPEQWRASCIAGAVQEIYSSISANYLIGASWYQRDTENPSTQIHKFSLENGQPEYRGSGKVQGNLVYPQPFALGEHKGVLRAISTVTDWNSPIEQRFKHVATSLREAQDGSKRLEVIGQIPNKDQPKMIGKPGEQIYSTRYFGDYAYVVTFQKVDPMYVINFVDPENPYIEGEVELPGFSEYLHPIGEGYVLGMGKDAAETDEDFAWYQGLKLSLFNVTNPANPTVQQEMIIGKRGTSSPILYDHKAISLTQDEAQRYRFAMPVSLHDSASGAIDSSLPDNTFYPWVHDGLYLFQLNLNEEKALTLEGILINTESKEDQYQREYINNVQRSLIMDDTIHYIDHGQVWSANWDNPEAAIGPQ